ncbi:MAG: hypothetical protein R8M38_06075 [Mariprofundaceae bacterium]
MMKRSSEYSMPLFIAVLVLGLSVFTIGCGGGGGSSSSESVDTTITSHSLQGHLSDFNRAADDVELYLDQAASYAMSIGGSLSNDDYDRAASSLDQQATNLDDLSDAINRLETAEYGIAGNIPPSNSRGVFPERFFAVLAGTLLFTYATKTFMDKMKRLSDDQRAAYRDEGDANDKIFNNQPGGLAERDAARQIRKEKGLEALNEVTIKVVVKSTLVIINPISVTGIIGKDLAGRALKAGLKALSVTEKCKTDYASPDCRLGVTTTDSTGGAKAPNGTIDIIISGSGKARVEVTDISPINDTTEVTVDRVNVPDATPTHLGTATSPNSVGANNPEGSTTPDIPTGTEGDSCQYANDGTCDVPTYCYAGTDTTDCSLVTNNTDSCQYANDGACDVPTYCYAGTDTTDCSLVTNTTDSCRYANDGVCDVPTYCEAETDTTDCSLVINTADSCRYANDGSCDEGFSCFPGTDTTDCSNPSAGGSAPTTGNSGSGTSCSGAGVSGAYPSTEFNGLQIVTYSVNGLCLGAPVDAKDKPWGTVTRAYDISGINGSSVTISGNTASNNASCNSDFGSFWFQTDVTLTVGDKVESFSSSKPCDGTNSAHYNFQQPAYAFNLSIPVTDDRVAVQFEINQTYINPRFGNRSVYITGASN